MKKIVIFAILILIILSTVLSQIFYRKTNMKIGSPAFQNNSKIPSKYTCDGENINPPLSFSGVPGNAKSLALIMDDPDATIGTFDHWILFNISPETKEIKGNSVPVSAVQGLGSTNKPGYIGACPPSGTHRYFFKLYALDIAFNSSEKLNKEELEGKMQNHILSKAELIGLYSRF